MNRDFEFSQMARRILMHQLGEDQPANQMALAACAVYRKFLIHVSGILGEEGGLALFRYCLRRTQPAFPLYSESAAMNSQTILDALAASLEKQIPASIQEDSIAVLTTFLDVLATFIGASLTRKLLQEVWPDIDPFPSQETPQ